VAEGRGRVIDRQGEQWTAVLRSLVQLSEAGEEGVQRWVADRLRELGCEVSVLRYSPRDVTPGYELEADMTDPAERIAVVGRLQGTGKGRSLLVFAHPDSEPVRDGEGWRYAPFAGTIADGRLFGWGVADDLAGVAAMLCGFEAVQVAALELAGGLTIASTPSKRDARGIVAVLDRGYSADASVYLHPAESGKGFRELKTVTPGLLRFRITVVGRPAETEELDDTAVAHRAINPIDKAWVLYEALQSLARRRAAAVRHPALDAAAGRSTNLQIRVLRCGDEARLGRLDATCRLAGSVTFPPGEPMADVQEQIAEAMGRAAARDSWLATHPPVIEWLMGTNGAQVPVDHPLERVVCAAVASVMGRAPGEAALHAASDIRHPILHKGIPTVGLGPRAGALAATGHHDEWVDVEDYVRTVKIVAEIAARWCGSRAVV
jgi:acetylornithine deacetylase